MASWNSGEIVGPPTLAATATAVVVPRRCRRFAVPSRVATPSSPPPPPPQAASGDDEETGGDDAVVPGSHGAGPWRARPGSSLRIRCGFSGRAWRRRRSGGTVVAVRVLVVDDEVRLAEAVARGLSAEGFDVEVVNDGLDGLWRATEREYGAIVLDLLLPGMNGYEVCRTLRAEGVWTPILMLTAKSGEYDEAEGLDTGADDFLSKPFSFVVLVARLRAIARRGAGPRPVAHVVGDLVDRPGPPGGRRRAESVDLTAREFSLLEALAQRSPDVVTKAELLDTGLGRRPRRRPQRRRGVRRLPPAQDRRRADPDGPRCRLSTARPRFVGRGRGETAVTVRVRVTRVAVVVTAVALAVGGWGLVRSVERTQLGRIAAGQRVTRRCRSSSSSPAGSPPSTSSCPVR